MSISPISVSLGNNYNISFVGNKKKEINNRNQNHSTMPLKAIPLAVLLAMAPLNESYSQNLINDSRTRVSVYNHSDGTSTKIFTYKEDDPNVLQTKDSLKLVFTSTDGDDKPEQVVYSTNDTDYSSVKDENGNKIKVIVKEKETVKCKALEKKLIKGKDVLGKPFEFVGYSLHGSSVRTLATFDRENPQIRVGKPKIIKNPQCVMSISENMYNKIANTMGDKIQYIDNTK